MSQAGSFGNTGGGGGVTAVVGQSSLVAPTVTVTTVAGTATVEDRAWQTQYVVDPSTTQGLRGTFSTIQAALNQAVADGMAYNNQKVIYIRIGLYTENLVIPPGTILTGETISFPVGGAVTPTDNTHILGSHTFTGNAVCAFNNIIFQTTTGNIFDGTSSAIDLFYFDNCILAQIGTGNIIDNMPAGSYISFSRSSFLASDVTNSILLRNGASTLFMDSCVISQPFNISIDAGTFNCRNTTGIGHTELTGGSTINALSCDFSSSSEDYVIDASVSGNPGTLRNCQLGLADIACVSAAGGSAGAWYIDNCATGTTASPAPNSRLYANTSNVNSQSISVQGSLIKSSRTATNKTMDSTDYYLGVTNTSSARTILLPIESVSNHIQRDKTYIIKDESGGAAANNITVTTAGAVSTIDGAATKVINTNYGFIRVIYDGTNYFTI